MEVVNDFDKNDWSRSVESLIKTVSNKNGSSERAKRETKKQRVKV